MSIIVNLRNYCKLPHIRVLSEKGCNQNPIYQFLRTSNYLYNTNAQMATPNLSHSYSISANAESQKHLLVNPPTCLHDEPIQIQAKGLSPGEEVTLRSSIQNNRNQTFFAYSHYKGNSSGIINTETDESLGGSYEGLFPMGPIMCLLPGPDEKKYLRFLQKDVSQPLKVDFKLIKGHVGYDQAYKPDPSLVMDSVIHERIFMAPGTERIPVREGKVRGTLFLPKGDGPFPGVVDMFGTAGGLIEFRAAQFASRGIAALAIAYFDFEDLPKNLTHLDIDYFEEAVNYLRSNKKVKKDAVGAVGVSKGADLACSLATFIPEVKAAVSINGIPVNTWYPLVTKHKTYPELQFDLTKGTMVSEGLMSTIEMMNDSEKYPETHIPLHEADAEFLFVVGMDDQNWKTDLETTRSVERMKAHGKSNFEVLKYDGAGHLIEPPFSPHGVATFHKMAGMGLLWGGEPKSHNAAQVDSWSKILAFFKRVLS